MLTFFIIIISLYGINFVLWSVVGVFRLVWETLFSCSRKKHYQRFDRKTVLPSQVAILIPAHNEELVLEKTILPALEVTSKEHIYVVSDGSSDRTVEIANQFKCNVLDIKQSRGKAGALEYALEYFNIYSRYELAMFLDADTEIDRNYLKNALPFFSDPRVVALAGYAQAAWPAHRGLSFSGFLVSYRSRVYRLLQTFVRFGQTWGALNLTAIVPGFASLYSTKALKTISMNPEGLVIEDYNMTFEVLHKKLGGIAHHPSVFATTQDPDNWHDYWKQVKRWNLGFWQTVRAHGVWPSLFWVSESFFLGEIFIASLFFLVSPVLILLHFIFLLPIDHGSLLFSFFSATYFNSGSLFYLLGGIIAADYFLTIIVSVFERRPKMLFYGFAYVILRWVDAWMFYYTFFLAFFVRSDGRWNSPKRRAG